MKHSATPFSSPLGALHHAPPSQQGETVRALVSLFHLGRRNRTASSTSSSSSSSSSKRLNKPAPSYSTLECTFDPPTGGKKSTYSPSSPSAFSPSPPPPPYSATAAPSLPPSGLEEDLLIFDEVAHALGLETKAERKERLRREKRERERREVVEADGRMDEALRGLRL
ncbi:hypothetical protein JCM6882_009490 [Rhodosporidiobolus microsporus]